jgi:Xaa-Pro dipeptidase
MKPQDRISMLQEKIVSQDLAGVLLSYSRNILYYTGTAQPSYLVVLPEDCVLFIRSGFEFAVNDVFISQEKMKEERRLGNIYREIFAGLKTAHNRIGTELDILTVEQFKGFQNAFPDYDFVNISPAVFDQRKKKDLSEIERIRKACDTLHQGHEAVLDTLRVQTDITELELAAVMENAHRVAGHEGIFFIRQPDFFMSRGPIASGPNLFKNSGVVYTITGVGLSPSVPAGPSQRKIEKGDVIIIDIPTHVDGYHADQTRTYVLGEADEKIRTMYDNLKEIADHLIENMKPGMKCSEIYGMAIKKAEELDTIDSFLNFGKGRRSRLLGHGVGLELNEPPVPSEYDHSEIDEDYVIALDMHMMDESVGVVKLEDMILIKDEGNEILTKSPRHLFEIT